MRAAASRRPANCNRPEPRRTVRFVAGRPLRPGAEYRLASERSRPPKAPRRLDPFDGAAVEKAHPLRARSRPAGRIQYHFPGSTPAAPAHPQSKTIVNFIDQPTCESVLRTMLRRDPTVSLDAIRDAHPVFQRMSPDQLSLRLSRVLEDRSFEMK